MDTPKTIVNRLLDTLKAEHNITSEAGLARLLSERSGSKVHQMNIHRWRRGELPPSFRVLASELIAHSNALQNSN